MKDLNVNENNDLKIENGDFTIGNSDTQHQLHILLAEKGEYKEHPEVGVGIQNMLSEHEYTPVILEIKKQLEYDGMALEDIKFNKDGTLNIDGKYN